MPRRKSANALQRLQSSLASQVPRAQQDSRVPPVEAATRPYVVAGDELQPFAFGRGAVTDVGMSQLPTFGQAAVAASWGLQPSTSAGGAVAHHWVQASYAACPPALANEGQWCVAEVAVRHVAPGPDMYDRMLKEVFRSLLAQFRSDAGPSRLDILMMESLLSRQLWHDISSSAAEVEAARGIFAMYVHRTP